MGSIIELNDTLQITKEQGFPTELDVNIHIKNPYKFEDFKDKIFSFQNKKDIRVYKIPPVRNFLVENVNGKWIYWGLAHVVEITHDYVNRTTAGKFKIIYLNSPQEMKAAQPIVDGRPEIYYFEEK